MPVAWGRNWSGRKWLKVVLIVIAVWVAFYAVVVAPLQQRRRMEEATGVAAVGWDPISLWHQRSLLDLLPATRRQSLLLAPAIVEKTSGGLSLEDSSRKIARSVHLEIETGDPSAGIEHLHALSEQLGGYLVSSQLTGDPDAPSATINIRVPTSRYEEAIGQIKKMADRIRGEKVDAADVTQNYVDRDANLRNLRAEEAQYLQILRRAGTVKDTLDVTEKLSEVRGQIEQQQAEFLVLAKQIETVAISVSLIPTAEAQVFGLHWRPWYSIKLAARDGMESLATFAGAFAAAIFLLPAIILWVAMIILCAAIGIRVLRWAWRRFFNFSKPGRSEPQPAAGP